MASSACLSVAVAFFWCYCWNLWHRTRLRSKQQTIPAQWKLLQFIINFIYSSSSSPGTTFIIIIVVGRQYPWVNLRVYKNLGDRVHFFPLPLQTSYPFIFLPLYTSDCITQSVTWLRGRRRVYITPSMRISQYLCRYVCFGLITFCGSSRERERLESVILCIIHMHTYNGHIIE